MHILLRYLLIVFVVVLAGNIAFAQRDITYIDLPEPNFIQNQLPSYSEFRQQELARVNSVNNANNLVAPTVINPINIVCTRSPFILNVSVIAAGGGSIAFMPTATSTWQLISRTGNVFISVSADTTFYVAELNATLDTIGPRVPVSVVYREPPSPLNLPREFVLCPDVENRLNFNNPEGLPVFFSGAFSGSTSGNFIIVPEGASGIVSATKSNGPGLGCAIVELMTVIPAIPTPAISPNNLLFCSRPEDVLFASARTIRYDIYRLETDPNPILSIVPGELVPASVFVGTDSSFYIAAITSPQCAGVKQLVTYSILSDSINAGDDIASCIGVSVGLNARAPRSGQTGRWAQNPNVTFSNINSPNSTVTGSRVGEYELVWVVSSPQCPDKTDKVTFTVSGFNPIQATNDIIACEQTIEIPYFASPNVQVALYPNANGTNPITVVNSGQPIIVTQTAEQERYYLGYVNAECRTPLKEINVTRSVQPIVNFAENYKVCQLLNTSIVVRNPIVNSGLQPLKLGTFSSNTSGVIIDWNSSGAFLTISGLQLNNFYTIRYEYSIGNCPPALGSFVIDTYGNPPIPESDLEITVCSPNYTLNLPKGLEGNSVYLDGVTDGGTNSNATGVFPVFLSRPVTIYKYGFFNTECGRGPSRQITINYALPFQDFTKIPNIVAKLGDQVLLTNRPPLPGYQYTWSNFSAGLTTNIYNANVRPDKSGNYFLKVVSPEGCEYYDTVFVLVNSDFVLPNMFTPNGNGQNETFGIASKTNITTPYELTIVNKYGQVVFSKSGQYINWNGDLSNGNPAPQDTYYYRIKFTEGLDDKIGSVQLVR